MAAVLALAPLPHPALAGHYAGPSYSGGSVTYTEPGATLPYGTLSGRYGGGASGSTSVTCAGTIVATFVWQPDGPGGDPPDNVIVQEWCDAWGHGFAPTKPSSAASNDLGFEPAVDEPASYSPFPPMHSTSTRAQGTRYRVVQGLATLPITCTPSASCSGGGAGDHEAVVWYTCSVTPVLVTLGLCEPSGGIDPASPAYHPSAIVGGRVMAFLHVGDLTPQTYSWSISGGDPFLDWAPLPWSSTPPWGGRDDWPGTQATAAVPRFGFARATFGDNAITACTAQCTVPAGCQPATLTVNGHVHCNVDKPSHELWVYIGSVGLVPNLLGNLDMALQGVPQGTGTVGTSWTAGVVTPPSYGSGGGWSFTSLASPDMTWGPATPPDGALWCIGMTGLDTFFGYQPHWPDLYDDLGGYHTAWDSPGITVSVQGRQWARMNGSYVTYTLYLPPGAGSMFVALKDWDWFCSGHAWYDPVTQYWNLDNAAAGWGFLTDFPRQPEWATVITGQ